MRVMDRSGNRNRLYERVHDASICNIYIMSGHFYSISAVRVTFIRSQIWTNFLWNM